jgi:hypothetical protein
MTTELERKLMNSKISEAINKILEIRLDRQQKYGDDIFNETDEYFKFYITEKFKRAFITTDIEAKKDSLLDLALYSIIYYTSIVNKEKK